MTSSLPPSGPKDIHEVLREHWGYTQFRPVQEDVIRSVMAGKDTLALLPTGGGKSICFQVPALATGRLCLVISPLIALMKDQVERLKRMGIPARAITSAMSHVEIDNTLESAAVGRLAFLYVSPERIGSELFQARLPRMPIGIIAVDEAHCISQWGYDFRPSYLRIQELREKLPGIPVLALTATATPAVAMDIMEKLGFQAPHAIRGNFHRPELVLWVSHGEDRHGRLLKVLRNIPGTAIVYVRERRITTRIASLLNEHGIQASAYHAGLTTEQRDTIQQEWTTGNIRCVVATNAFGMGIDKSDVRCVVHLEPPPDLESYYQEAGRGGRDGKTAHAFLLTGPGDAEKLQERVERGFPTLDEVRRVYQAFANEHRIAVGSASLESYDLDLAALAKRCGLPASTTAAALKTLELDGKLALSEGARTPSRILIIADQRVIYHLRVNDRRFGPVLEALLRAYGGLYEEPVLIEEHRIARLLDTTVEKLVKLLNELDRQRVLMYRPRSDAPRVTLLTPRMDAQRMTLDPAAHRDRIQRAQDRMDAMLDFVNGEECRMRMLLRYFGEPMERDCGHCDRCMVRKPPSLADQAHQPLPDNPTTVAALRTFLDEHSE
ncbi:MAG: ATP-dependent DNA helicase RecQ [Flavobacteriales bacterium]|jgi:ATP-dependent DNA helicase RecQ